LVETTTPKTLGTRLRRHRAVNPGGLNKSKQLDLRTRTPEKQILDEGITLLDTFKIASSYDSIASEWVNHYPITFDLGYPYLAKELKKNGQHQHRNGSRLFEDTPEVQTHSSHEKSDNQKQKQSPPTPHRY
jgi:hypothetical protein